MSDMKCPFCKEEIISDLCLMFDKKDIDFTNGRQIYKCNKCGLFGNKKLWQELIRTRKALQSIYDYTKIVSSELAKNHLGQFQKPISKIGDMAHIALKAEQKD